MADTPRLAFPEISSSQANKEVTHNEALKMCDAFTFCAIEDKDLTAPPGSPAHGQLWIVGTGATGAWATHDGELAQYYNSGWVFYDVIEGMFFWVKDENLFYVFDGSALVELTTGAAVQALTPGDNVSVDWSNGLIATILLNRATTTFAFSGATNGQRCILVCIQDGSGGRAIAFGAEVRGNADLTIPPTLTATLNKVDYLGFIYLTATTKYDFVSFAKGY